MEKLEINRIKTQLLEKRERLQQVSSQSDAVTQIRILLNEVDSALSRIENGSYGFCEVCSDPIEEDRLMVDPLTKVCIDHLDITQKRMLEEDLDLANNIQKKMLPQSKLLTQSWDVNYHYEPAGAVSGDYCDIIDDGNNNNSRCLFIGDVSGKGIAASMLMSHLHAMFHSLIPVGLNLTKLFEHANRLFCESTLSSHYVTLIGIRAYENGKLEVCNAGHPPPLLIKKNQIEKLTATGLPIGMFSNSEYSIKQVTMEPGDSLFIYTDGLTEAFLNNQQYGLERVIEVVSKDFSLSAPNLVNNVLIDLRNYLSGFQKQDDLTIMALKKL